MEPTTTLERNLENNLKQKLTAAGLTPYRTARVVNLLPPAGRHWLHAQLDRDPQNTFPRLAHMHPEVLADNLRTTTADAITVRKIFKTGVQR